MLGGMFERHKILGVERELNNPGLVIVILSVHAGS
jgi:hypothetical protein